MDYQLHPLCTLFPRMSGHEFECLKLDIKENGLRTPITIYKSMILDGGNRYKACVELGINPTFETFVGEEIGAFVLTSNLHRRHLSVAQSAAIVASVQDWGKAQPVGKPKCATNSTLADTVKSRSNQSGASIATQRKADAVSKANPELAAKVGRGEISLNDATREVAPQLAPKLHSELPEPVYTELDEAHDTIAMVRQEYEQGQNQLAAMVFSGTEEEKTELLTRMDNLLKENADLARKLREITRSRDDLMLKVASLTKDNTRLSTSLKKLHKADNGTK